MIHHLIRLIFEGAAAMGGALFADKVVTDTTGQHIHEHIFTWYCELRDYVLAWLNQNQHLNINRIAYTVLDRIDELIREPLT